MKRDIICVLCEYLGEIGAYHMAKIVRDDIPDIPWITRILADNSRVIALFGKYIKIEYTHRNGLRIYKRGELHKKIDSRGVTNVKLDKNIDYHNHKDSFIFTYNFGYKDSYDYHIYPDYTIRVWISDCMNTWELDYDGEIAGYNDDLAVNRLIYESFADIPQRYHRIKNNMVKILNISRIL
jgi:hypothetical protein